MTLLDSFWLTPLREAAVKLTGNQAKKGDSDFGQPGPVPGKGLPKTPGAPANNNSNFNQLHPRGGQGSTAGGKFVSKGDTGGEVSTIQDKLGIAQTGTFDAGTATSIIAFQRRHGLQADGVVGVQTALALSGQFRQARATAPGPLTDKAARSLGGKPDGPQHRTKRAARKHAANGERVRGGFLVDALSEEETLQESVMEWTESLHPRDGFGKFVRKISQLTPRGQAGATAIDLPDGTRVQRDRDGSLRVTRSGRIVRGIEHADVAATDALMRSARSTHGDSIGGVTARRDFAHELIGADLTAGRTQASIPKLRAYRAQVAASQDEYVRRQLPAIDQRIAHLYAEHRHGRLGAAPPSTPDVVPGQSAGPGAPLDSQHAATRAEVANPISPTLRVTVRGHVRGRDATIHLYRGGRDVYFSEGAIAGFQTRTGTRVHWQPATFQRAPEGFVPRRTTPHVVIDGSTFVMAQQGVALNRPASLTHFHEMVGPPQRMDQAQNPGRLLAPGETLEASATGSPSPRSVPEKRLHAANVQAQLESAVIAHLRADSGFREPQRGVALVDSQTDGRTVWVRSRLNGQTWSANVAAIQDGQPIPHGAIKTHTSPGSVYTAPGVENRVRAAFGRPSSENDTQTSRSVPSSPSHPDAPAAMSALGTPALVPSSSPVPAAQPSVAVGHPAPPIPSEVNQAIGHLSPEHRENARRIINELHGFKHNGYTMTVTGASGSGGSFQFSGTVLDPQGRATGASISRDVNFGSKDVYHAYFTIPAQHRASGFGAAWINKSFETYKANGIDQVRVSAALSTGGYMWAKMGFNFTGRSEADRISQAKQHYAGNRYKLEGAVRAGHFSQDLLDEMDRVVEEGMISSTQQLAALGRRKTWKVRAGQGEVDTWPGKVLMLESDWSGIKYLREPSSAA